jgi:hypothetical protein
MNAYEGLALKALSTWPTMTLKAKKKLLLFKKWQKALACHLCSWMLNSLAHLPQGGSIDDLTAEELAGAAEKIEKAASLFQKPAKALATTAKKPEKKEKTAPAKPPVSF